MLPPLRCCCRRTTPASLQNPPSSPADSGQCMPAHTRDATTGCSFVVFSSESEQTRPLDVKRQTPPKRLKQAGLLKVEYVAETQRLRRGDLNAGGHTTAHMGFPC